MKILSIFLTFVSTILVGFFVWIYFIGPNYVVHALSTNNTVLSPKQSFVIKFSSPVSKFNFTDKIKIYPQTDINIKIAKNEQALFLTPINNWKPGTDYTVELSSIKSKNLKKLNSSKHHFTVTSFPKITNILPKDGTKNLEIDFKKPIQVFLDKSTDDFYVDFFITPDIPFKVNKKDLNFEILPTEKLKADTEYTLEAVVKIKNLQNGPVEKYVSAFKTEPPRPKKWAKNHSERLEQAKRYTKAKITDGKYIDINLTNQVMSIFENGKNIDSFMISTGKPGMRTPVGNHKIYNKFPRPYSKKYGLYMPNWMAITPTGSHGIHELPEWPGGYKEGQNHLGIPVSHGCVRLGVGSAKRVYDWAKIGTPVIVYYGKI